MARKEGADRRPRDSRPLQFSRRSLFWAVGFVAVFAGSCLAAWNTDTFRCGVLLLGFASLYVSPVLVVFGAVVLAVDRRQRALAALVVITASVPWLIWGSLHLFPAKPQPAQVHTEWSEAVRTILDAIDWLVRLFLPMVVSLLTALGISVWICVRWVRRRRRTTGRG